MVSNINNLGNNTPIKQQAAQQAQVKQQNAQASTQTSQAQQVRQDSVSLTPQARQLNELQRRTNDSNEINQKKVDQLKKAIESGEYKVDSEKLAASIARFEFDLV